MVGSARRSGPKPQSRLRLVDLLVGEKRRLPHGRQSFRVRCVVSQKRHKGGQAAKVGRLGDPSLPSLFDRRCRASREKGEWPSLACGMQSLFHQARPFMTVVSKPHRRGTPSSLVGHASFARGVLSVTPLGSLAIENPPALGRIHPPRQGKSPPKPFPIRQNSFFSF
jgi:hypothetical protein